MNLIIGGVEVTFLSAYDVNQKLSPVTNGTLLRMADGSAVKQRTWSKTRTTISASGLIPEGLQGVDFDNPIIIDCIAERSITSASNIIAIADTVRTDKDPIGMAYVNGTWENVVSTWVIGTLTIDVTAGATLYQARWMPRLTMYFDEPEPTTDISNATFSWSLDGEEV